MWLLLLLSIGFCSHLVDVARLVSSLMGLMKIRDISLFAKCSVVLSWLAINPCDMTGMIDSSVVPRWLLQMY